MESEIVIPQKPLFCRRYVDDIYNRRKMFKHDELFEKLNNYHPEIKLTIEVSRTNVLDTRLHLNNGIYDFKVYRETKKQPTHWSRNLLKDTNVTGYSDIYIDLITYLQILVKK